MTDKSWHDLAHKNDTQALLGFVYWFSTAANKEELGEAYEGVSDASWTAVNELVRRGVDVPAEADKYRDRMMKLAAAEHDRQVTMANIDHIVRCIEASDSRFLKVVQADDFYYELLGTYEQIKAEHEAETAEVA
jgi:hypothetical protein